MLHGGGPHSFHICPASYKNDPTQDCLDGHRLEFENGEFEVDLKNAEFIRGNYPPEKKKKRFAKYKVK